MATPETERSGQATPSRDHSLDGLRGLASLMVAGCHFIIAFYPALLTGNPSMSHFAADVLFSQTGLVVLFNPEFCVAIFFVLSGFVLAASVSQTRQQLQFLVLRRWLRLALPVIAASLFAWIIPRFGLNFAQAASAISKSVWLAAQYAPIKLTGSEFCKLLGEAAFTLWFPHGPYGDITRFYNSNLWTMPIEFAGSVGLYAVYRLFHSWRVPQSARFIVIAVILASLWNSPCDGFPAGTLLFELHRICRPALLPVLFSNRIAMLLPGALIMVLGVLLGGTPFNINMQGHVYAPIVRIIFELTAPVSPIPLLHRFGAFCVVASVLIFDPARRLLQHRMLQFLGRISFMVYLVQIPVLCSAGAGVLLFATPRIGYGSAVMLAAAAYLAGVISVATAMTRLVDLPALKASKILTKALQSRIQPDVAIT